MLCSQCETWKFSLEGSKQMRRYESRPRDHSRFDESRADRTTTWLLLLVITALVIALTFSDANGSVTGLIEML